MLEPDESAIPGPDDAGRPDSREVCDDLPGPDADETPMRLPIDGTLDLHTFRPAEVKSLVPDYLHECRRLGLLDVRIVHGKGTGTLRRSVHAVLARLSIVERFGLAGAGGGGWGATLVRLRPPEAKPGPR